MRLRVLSEAECYTRCYGGRRGERVSLIRILSDTERRQAEEAKLERRRKAA